MAGMKRTQIYISEQMIEELDKIRAIKCITRSEAIRVAIEMYLKKNK